MSENTYTPKQTAIWLIDNTTLTFKQIAEFCDLHAAEVEAIADGTVAGGMVGENPVMNGELLKEEIERCEADPEASLTAATNNMPKPKKRAKGPKYTPVSKRGDKPDAIQYILKNQPDMTDAQIVKLIGTTKNTIEKIRTREHSNIAEIKPRHPADLGLCSYTEFEAAVEKALKAAGKTKEDVAAEKQENQTTETNEDSSKSNDAFGGFDFSNFMGTSSDEDEKTGS